jgi:hypothetical protein
VLNLQQLSMKNKKENKFNENGLMCNKKLAQKLRMKKKYEA